VQQLLKSNLIQIKDFLWSDKGKKINIYKVSKKFIIIAPTTSSLKDLIPVALSGFIASFGIYYYTLMQNKVPILSEAVLDSSETFAIKALAAPVEQTPLYDPFILSIMFLFGFCMAMLVYCLIRLARRKF
jgi:hypothetical protein